MNKIYAVCQICNSSFPPEENVIAYYKNIENALQRSKEEESSDKYGYFFTVKEFELEDDE